MTKKISFGIFAFLAIGVSFYPLRYLLTSATIGLLDSKSAELLSNTLWNTGFYTHIVFGGLALLTGWSQFSGSLRRKRMNLHRNLGKFYCLAVLLSGLAGVYIGFYATGGIVPSIGFVSLGFLWLSSTALAYKAVREKRITDHQKWMILSYAACFAAVTLRLWLPLLIMIFGGFLTAYKIVAWLCWVPNLFFAVWLVKKRGLA